MLPTLGSSASVELSLRFATVHPSGLLAYNGRYDTPQADYITVQMLVGQVIVGVSFGGVATVLKTDSEQRLNDGMWHHVQVRILDRVSLGMLARDLTKLALFLSGCHGYCL